MTSMPAPRLRAAAATALVCLLLGGGATTFSACGAARASAPAAPGGPGLHVLFVGNSLTYVNDLPGIVEALADANGDAIETRTVAFPDYSLEDHWNDGTAGASIAKGGWSVVVLQQGPSALPDSRVLLLDYARRFAALIRAAGAAPAFYAAWPTADRTFDYAASAESYRLAADSTGGMLFPVSSAWSLVLTRDPTIGLYAVDGLHATPSGSYLAALVIYSRLFGRSPVGLPASLRLRSGASIVVPVATAPVLQRAAADALSGGK